jgi:hypothetical protein
MRGTVDIVGSSFGGCGSAGWIIPSFAMVIGGVATRAVSEAGSMEGGIAEASSELMVAATG